MPEHCFDVYGIRVVVAVTKNGWTPYLLDADGKRRRADFVIPSFIEEKNLGQYLADLLHEVATPKNKKVLKVR